MKKVMSINLGGFAFKIDEDAFQTLEQYILSIKSKFKVELEQREIIGDIEFRISEIFTNKLKSNFREVINIEDVHEIIKKLGKPETIAGEEGESSTHQSNTQRDIYNTKEHTEKRLFRNPDDKIISGICSGLSAYLGITDPLWIRIIFTILLLSSVGTIALIYIIGMIIIPEAKTTSQKLQMVGKPVTLQNIEDNFNNVKESINNSTVSNGLSNLIYLFIKIIKFFVAGILIIIGLAVLTAFTIALITGKIGQINGGLFDYSMYLVDDTSGISLLMVSLYFIVGIPCLSLILLGIRVLINRTFMSTPFRILLLSLWIIAIILFSYTMRNGYKMFSSKANIEETIPLPTSDKILTIKSSGKYDIEIDENEILINGHQLKNGKLVLPTARLNIVKSPTGKAFLEKVVRSNGNSRDDAENNAKQIISPITVSDSILFIDQWIEINNDKPKFRNQKVKYFLNLPIGAKIYLHSSSESLLYDIKNVHDMRDSKMYGHVWQMSEFGLTCIDCTEESKIKDNINYDEDRFDENDENGSNEKKIIKKIINGNIHIKDGNDEVYIKDGKIIVKEGNEEKVIIIDKQEK